MRIKTFLLSLALLLGLSALLAGCSTGRAGSGANGNMQADNEPETAADTGSRYLLGHGVARNDSTAFYYFSKGADDDDPFAENEVAYLYAAGKGTSQDYAKALSYYQKAANHGLASAQYNLGLMYAYGLGTAPNKALAAQWIQRSAARGFEPAKQVLSQYR